MKYATSEHKLEYVGWQKHWIFPTQLAWFNQDFSHESDLLSVALGESGLNLSEDEPFTTFDRNESGMSTGGSLSLESTSTPSELLNWTLYLTNPNNQTPLNVQDDLSRYLGPYNDFKSGNSHDTDTKSSFPSRNDQTSSLDLYPSVNDLFSQSGSKETVPNKNSESLIDLLGLNNELSVGNTVKYPNKVTANGPNGLVNKTELQLQRK